MRVEHESPKLTPRGRSGHRALTAVQVGVDLAAIIVAFVVSYLLYTLLIIANSWYAEIPGIAPYAPLAGLYCAIALLSFWHLGLYRARSTVLNLWELQAVPQGIALAAASFFAILFFLKLEGYSRVVVVGAIATSAPLLILERRLIAVLTRYLKLRGRLGSRVLIHGCGPMGQLLMKKIVQAPGLCRTVIGFVDDNEAIGRIISCRLVQDGSVLFQASVLGQSSDLRRVIEEHGVDELLVVMPAFDVSRMREILDLCKATDTIVGVVPQLGELRSDRLAIEDLSAIPVLRPCGFRRSSLYLTAKRAMDVVISSAMIVLTALFVALVALLIKLDSPGPVLFIQDRVGLNGRRFRMLKFRTMRAEANPYAPSPAGDVHPDITRVGRILRIGGMDELPQLINVLRGDMSLVGPRPEMPFIVDRYGRLERERLTVKPGITGVWQLSADRHSEIHENIEYDLYYVSHASIMLDLVILIETALFTFGLVIGGLRRHAEAPAVRVQAEARNGRVWRGATNRLAEAQFTSFGTSELIPSQDPYVLVALDQRRNGSIPQSWQRAVPAAQVLASQCPVKTLVAETNMQVFDRLLDEPATPGTNRFRTEYALYRTLAELRELASKAILVVTDLEHVAYIARCAKVNTVMIEPGGARWASRFHGGNQLVNTLGSLLTIESELAEEVSSR
jgi:exopolysaccharide biosynthesis polyprenyl glycosylphosphotransferase